MTFFKRIWQSIQDIVRKADMKLLGLCLVCTAFGLLLIASATAYLDYKTPGTQMKRVLVQAAGAMLGIGAYFIFSNIDMEHFAEKWWLFLIFNIGFIALLRTPLGIEGGGNRSWLSIKGLPVNIQPAEIVRLTFTVLLAKQMAWFRDNRQMKGFSSLIFPAVHAGFMFVWIYVISKDAGSGLMYLVIYAGMALAAGLAWYWFAIGFTGLGLSIGLLALFEKLPVYWVERFHVLFDHSYSPQGRGYQQTRGMLALGSGGFFGQGLFQGIQTQGVIDGSLPARQTDFIFCVCGEELGFVGCLAIIVLESLVIFRSLQTARLAKSSMDALICVGFGSMLIFQTLENIGMCLFVMPVIGLTLPFFSYGGSSIVALYAALGMVSGVRGRTLPDWLRKT